MIEMVVSAFEWIMGMGLVVLLFGAFVWALFGPRSSERYRGAGTLEEDRD